MSFILVDLSLKAFGFTLPRASLFGAKPKKTNTALPYNDNNKKLLLTVKEASVLFASVIGDAWISSRSRQKFSFFL